MSKNNLPVEKIKFKSYTCFICVECGNQTVRKPRKGCSGCKRAAKEKMRREALEKERAKAEELNRIADEKQTLLVKKTKYKLTDTCSTCKHGEWGYGGDYHDGTFSIEYCNEISVGSPRFTVKQNGWCNLYEEDRD